MSPSPDLLVLASEAVLSLYPILIKTVPTNLYTQWFARFLTFPVLATILRPSSFPPPMTLTTLLIGFLNLVHIVVSYLSFSLLPAGVALSLFYIYPITNLLAGSIFFGEPLRPLSLILLFVSFVGVFLLATSSSSTSSTSSTTTSSTTTPSTTNPSTTPPSTTNPSSYIIGVIMALAAAVTETLLYVFVRWNKQASASPFSAIQQFYPVGLAVLLIGLIVRPNLLDLSPASLLPLFAFNALIGFTGYATRFYAIPKVSTLIFSVLAFVGVIFGYVWGHLFTLDKTSPTAWLGSALITLSAFMVRYALPSDS